MADPVPGAAASPGRPYSLETFTASDGYRWRYRHYAPPGKPRAHVVCLHGIQSHAGWYEHSCTRLSRAGYAVSFLDRRGSGMNERDRGDAPSFRRLIDDVAEFLACGMRNAVCGMKTGKRGLFFSIPHSEEPDDHKGWKVN